MKSHILLLSLLLGGFLSLKASLPQDKQVPWSGDFAKQWAKVDSLSHKGLPKSALEVVDRIYQQAKKEKNDPQYVKAIIFKMKLQSDYREDALVSTIRDLKREVATAEEPVRQILNSLLAEVYWKYYQNNRYRFSNRTEVLNNISDSIQTWDLNTLTHAIIQTYQLSLEHAGLLQTIPILRYEAILESPEKHQVVDRKIRPTLYDFLVWRSLDYFMNSESTVKGPAETFRIDNAGYFSLAAQFTRMQVVPPKDTTSLDYYAVGLFRDLAAFHLQDNDPAALIDEELQRFDFFRERCTLEGKDTLYLASLKALEQKHITFPSSTDVSFALAQFFRNQAYQYKPLASESHKWDKVTAKGICEKAIHRFPESDGAKNCALLVKEMQQPTLSFTMGSAILPGKPSLGMVEFSNLPSVNFRMITVDPESTQEKIAGMTQEEKIAYLTGITPKKTWSLVLPQDGDMQSHRIECKIPETTPGYYMLLCSSDNSFRNPLQVITWAGFFSTQISYLDKLNDKNGLDVYLLDRETGIPLKNLTVEAFQKNYNYTNRRYESKKIGDFVPDEKGFLSIPPAKPGTNGSGYFFKIQRKQDLFITENFFMYGTNQQAEKPFLFTTFFTDRAIYRPGQTIYFKGIVLEKTGDKAVLKTGIETTVVFYDVNYQKIAEQRFITNAFGSFNGSFVAPQGVLPGQMSISNGSGTTFIRVEEYKRPTFEVTFQPMEGNYRLNDTLEVRGKAEAYAGNTIGNAQVRFRVVRTNRFPFRDYWWYPYPSSHETEVINGTVFTKEDGSFTFRFRAVPDLTLNKSDRPVFDYRLYADVTDLNGETQSGSGMVSVGYASLLIALDIPAKLNLAKDSLFKLSSTNLNGRKTPATVEVLFQQLRQPDHVFRSRLWEQPDLHGMTQEEFYKTFPHDLYSDEDNPAKWPVDKVVLQKTVLTDRDSLVVLSSRTGQTLVPGSYLVTLKSMDPYGEPVQAVFPVVVADPSSREVPVNAMDWFVPLKTSGEPGEKASFLLGSKEDVQVIYEIRVRDSLYSRQLLKVNNSQLCVEVPIREGFRGNFSVNFLFIRDNRAYQNSQLITVPYTNKKLDILYSSFRSKLTPGHEETWNIQVVNAAKKGVPAEYLTAMYDASLDAFVPNHWNFSVFRTYYGQPLWNTRGSFASTEGNYFPVHSLGLDYRFHQYEQLNWFGFGYFGGGRYKKTLRMGGMDANGSVAMLKELSAAEGKSGAPVVTEDAVQPDETVAGNGISEDKGPHPSATKENTSNKPMGTQVRRDFRETAFFYPSLVTDSTGSLMIKFTVPESLTRWKILGFAHTQELDYGQSEKEVYTQKELMVFPNAPRFVRQGDTVVLSAKVSNLSDRALSGDVLLELIDPVTSKPMNIPLQRFRQKEARDGNEAVCPFSLAVGTSGSFEWKFFIPLDPSIQALQYRITAKAGNFSDGEEKAIPVLTNRILVTESFPLAVKGKGTFDFYFDKLLEMKTGKSLKNYKLTLEFASNPAWYAIQALPTLDEPKFPNADNIFNAFYANSIAAYIANSNPAIRKVFEAWKSITPDALHSNLEKNQGMKSALLQETPWVMEAADETQRKQRLGLLFDLNTLSGRLDENMKKLERLQKPGGAWPWFEGMQESRYITQDIVTGMGHLDHLGITKIREDKACWFMVTNAVAYLDRMLAEDYEFLKKHTPDKMSENHLGSLQIQYLYARSYFLRDLPLESAFNAKTVKEAFDYYEKQSVSYWLQNDLELQGMIGLALNRLGNKEVPKMILRSLTEKAIHSPEMGMYWAANAGYDWYQAPVETQALMIEAFDEISADQVAVDEMKIWLLKQKQTQDWKTGKATVEACYALLLRGTDLLAGSPEVTITLGKQTVDPRQLQDSKVEAGTGYFQTSWSGADIQADMGKISITRNTEGIAWGALYWQYFEEMDKITPHQTPLKLEKKLYIETNTPSGPVLREIASSSAEGPYSDKTGHLKVGDKLMVRIILSVDRNLTYVHMKDLRASAFEPVISSREGGGALSGYRYQGGLGYYQSVTDASTHFFFDYLPKGTWVFEYPLSVNASGDYSNGITTIQCMYAPEFSAHSEGIRASVE
jgi:hypothetical protein